MVSRERAKKKETNAEQITVEKLMEDMRAVEAHDPGSGRRGRAGVAYGSCG